LVCFLAVCFIQFIILIDDTNLWNKEVFIAWAWQVLTMLFILVLFEYFGFIEISHEIYGIFNSLNFWLTLGFSIIISVIWVTLYQRLRLLFFDSVTNNLIFKKYSLDQEKLKLIKKIEKMSEISRHVAKFKKILKDDNFKIDNYGDKRVKIWVDKYKNSEYEDEERQKRRSIKYNLSNNLSN